MKRWIISDLHFGHINVIKYSNRPFSDVDEMNKELIKKWNNIVGKDDLVYVLGDFTLFHRLDKIKEYTQALNGRKILIMGNHDTRKPKDYIEAGFIQAIRKPIMVEPGVILMHEPFYDDKLIAKNYIYFFGHVHTKTCCMDNLPNCKCVCAERLDYKPINFDQALIELKNKNFLD